MTDSLSSSTTQSTTSLSTATPSAATVLTLSMVNHVSPAQLITLLEGVYEHSAWIAGDAAAHRPFKSLTALKYALSQSVRAVSKERQLALLRAHPELAGKAMVTQSLTAESTGEQLRAGLSHCSAAEFATLQQLNAQYNAKFGWPFILAVRGPRGLGLSRAEIIDVFTRRLAGQADFEFAECLRNVDRIAQLRLNDKFGQHPVQGDEVWDWAEQLAQHSDPGFAENRQLTVTYLTSAHQRCAAQLQTWMRDCGFDEVYQDAVGNVVGRYYGSGVEPAAQHYLLTGSHFDTVRNGGKYDGRLGIFVPMACVAQLHAQSKRLRFGLEVVGFAEEEGQRYKAAFLGSGALTGDFNPAWLAQADRDGITMAQAMRDAALPLAPEPLQAIAACRRDPKRYLGFVEVHIEQGPVLNELDLPIGIVTSINGSVRMVGEVTGVASHAGTTPMNRRKDAALAVAEFALAIEARARQDADSVGTVGMLEVPAGSINVIPGRCVFSVDLRAPNDSQRDALTHDVQEALRAICEKRGLTYRLEETMRIAAAPSDPAWQSRWEDAVVQLGLPIYRLPSGAGHDAMKLHTIMPQAMLFVRGGNSGISHNPLETITSDDAQLCVDAFMNLLTSL